MLSFAVLLLALLASSHPDLVYRWSGLQRPGNGGADILPPVAPRNAGESLPPPQPANRVAAEKLPPTHPAEPERTVVPIAIDMNATGAIEGRITDGRGRPEAGRTVSISAMQGAGRRATADAAGRYRREGLIPGVYMAVLDPPGGGPDPGGFGSVLVEVRKDETTTVDFLGERVGSLEGRITHRGKPAAGAQVRLLQSGAAADAGKRALRAAAALADETGSYRLADLAPGAYRMIVAFSSEEPRRGGTDAGDMVPGLARAEEAVTISPGENRQDVVLPEGRLDGKVMDGRAGTPIALALVQIVSADRGALEGGFYERYAELESDSLLSETDGTFLATGLAPGNYRVVATRAGYRQFTGTVTVGAGPVPLVVNLAPGGGRVEVELVIPQGVLLPLLNLRVTDPQGFDLGFYPMGGNDVDHALYERTQQAVMDLAPGRHVLELEIPGQGRFSADVDVREDAPARVEFLLKEGKR